ncbi:MAG TPA: alpha/beta hydrolase [Gaiellaceae bacterium]|nr:alpha/beta hydrolase [Gaiellaceae bacterium]
MPYVTASGVRLYYEEHGSGAPILCIHGTSSSALAWAGAVSKLAELGRVIVYDRRGCTRSERPEPYETTNVQDHTDDAREVLRALGAEPAIVIGRSYGGSVALDLALRYPESVRALVLLEAVLAGLSPETDAWGEALTAKLVQTVAERGIDAVGETFIRDVLEMWEELPAEWREMFTANGPAIMAEVRGGDLVVDAARLAEIRVPTLVVSGTDSAEEFRRVADVLADAIPHARAARVAGGHLVDPTDRAVLAFVSELASVEGETDA